jgi:hypothetical protein
MSASYLHSNTGIMVSLTISTTDMFVESLTNNNGLFYKSKSGVLRIVKYFVYFVGFLINP